VNFLLEIEGVVEEIVFTNESNGYTVCELNCNNNQITAVGYMPFINVGETLKVTGKWVTHPDYGMQLKVEMYEKVLPQTIDSMEKYLASGTIKGVGPATASKIINKFGEEAFNILSTCPERLAEIKGISIEKAIKIGQAFNEQKVLREVVMFFQKYGISPAFSAKIYRTFGDRTIEEIKANPYRLADEVFGIGFKVADRIAMSLGIDPASEYRVCSGIKYILWNAASNGHTFIPKDELIQYSSRLLSVDIQNIDNSLAALVMDGSIRVEKDGTNSNIYLSTYFQSEMYVAKKLYELSAVKFKACEDDFAEKIDKIQKQENIVLADMQKEAIKEALSNGVLVITGGPGTGKTTIIKSIIRLLHNDGCRVALAAPTGRAAKRMAEATGYDARTIHRLLEIGYMQDDEEPIFTKNETNPIDAEAVIIDEMSMVDIVLMKHLLKAVSVGTRLILVGDSDQLPSVGAGNVLKDIIKSGMIKVVKLTEIFRQAGESMIIVNAHRINRGEYPFLNVKDKDFFLLPRKNADDIVRTIVELSCKRLPASYGYDPLKHIQILAPAKKGITGVESLNIELQKALNPYSDLKNEKNSHGFTFREGDRVMQIKNNYTLRWVRDSDENIDGVGVFNGDIGTIRKIDNEEQTVTVLFDDDRKAVYDFGILDEINPAFAISVHKSQGSEFPVVILPLFPGPPVLMTRNLLYTAVTRARDLVILVGQEAVLAEMIDNLREANRYSSLDEKLKKCGEIL